MELMTYEVKNDQILGTIKFDMPNYLESMKLYKESNIKLVGGQVVLKNDSDELDFAIYMVDLSSKYVKVVDLKILSTGKEIKSFEDLGKYAIGRKLINEVGNMILGGIKLGEALEP